MWSAPYVSVEDRGDPDVVMFFDSSIARLGSEYLVDCYKEGDCAASQRDELKQKLPHYRYAEPRIFPRQVVVDGSRRDGRPLIRVSSSHQQT